MQSPFSLPARAGARAFTVIEIAVILIIIALMMVIVIPHFYSDWQGRKAERVKQDLVSLNSAIEHYALDTGKAGGAQPGYADLRKYLDPATDVYKRDGKDIFGDSYGPFVVGSRPNVPKKTEDKLSSVAGPDFWSPFQ